LKKLNLTLKANASMQKPYQSLISNSVQNHKLYSGLKTNSTIATLEGDAVLLQEHTLLCGA